MDISCSFKVSIVGVGRVGTTAAYAMMLDGTPTDIVLLARDKQKAIGEKLDLEHALPFLDYVNIIATDDYADIANSRLVVITAGAAQQPGETRLDLCNKNLAILQDILPKVNQAAPNAVVLIIANPVDVLTFWAHQIVPNAKGRIFGSGTTLDTARFRYHIGEAIGINPKSIHAYVLGEHGDSSFPVYANATIGGQLLMNLPGMNLQIIQDAYTKSRDAANKIIESKGATFYAIGVVATKIMEAIFSDAKTVFPLSVPLDNYYGHAGVALSVPCVLGARGVERVLEIDLSNEEQEHLAVSAQKLQQFCTIKEG
ncbi:MAG TPA: L-lactate dehydrogenase [Patescibacteria group bacterium]|nr:L-lactate dehydrogenase [Patescibacteria group bacterium]